MPEKDAGEKLQEEFAKQLSKSSKVQPFGHGLDNVFVGANEDFSSIVSASLENVVNDYISNPDTRVFINHNNDIEKWRYSVQVCGTDFWLNSFDTEQEALQYIEDNGLAMGD